LIFNNAVELEGVVCDRHNLSRLSPSPEYCPFKKATPQGQEIGAIMTRRERAVKKNHLFLSKKKEICK
jgi:hypothetical protein